MSKNDMNLQNLRKQFPIFDQKVHDHQCIYFDSASTAQMPQFVVDAIVAYYTTYKANVGRGVYTFAEQATAAYEHARKNVGQFIGAQPDQIVFTSGATQGINLVAQAWASHMLQQGDEIVVSAIEHHSNFLPWQQLAIHKKLVLKIVPVNAQGLIDLDQFQSFLSKKTKLVCIVHTSNLLGGTNDVEKIGSMAREVGAKVLIDASQSVAHRAIDVLKLGADFLVFSGHKLFGPTGIGVLYAGDAVNSHMRIVSYGGGMVFSVGQQDSKFKDFPHCFESGTPNVAGAIGLSAAIDFVRKNIDFDQLAEHETSLVQTLCNGLQKIDDIKIISFTPSQNQHGHLVTFYSITHHAHDIAAYLDSFGIAVRAGHHCVQLYHTQGGINASVRASFSVYNTQLEVEFFLKCLKKFLM